MSIRQRRQSANIQPPDAESPPPYNITALEPRNGAWTALDNDISIWDPPTPIATNDILQPGDTAARFRVDSTDPGRGALSETRRRNLLSRRNVSDMAQTQSQETSRAPFFRISRRSGSHASDLTPMEIDPPQESSSRARLRQIVSALPSRPSRSERMQDIRNDYHAAGSTYPPEDTTGPLAASPSASSNSASFQSARTNDSLLSANDHSHAHVDADYALALALQREEDERAGSPPTRRRSDQDRELAEAFQYDLDDEMTMNDAEFAAHLHEEEEALRMKLSRPQMRACAICSDDVHPLDFPAKPPSSDCTHLVNTCTSCLEKWVAADLDGRGWQRVSCPECRRPLNHDDMRRAAAPDVFERYDKLAARGALGADDDFHWCINAGCASGQIHDDRDGQSPVFECATCRFRQCVAHKMAWHEGETCQQYDYRVSGQADRDRRAKEDEASEATANATTQTCPKASCKAKIEKVTGCDHMVCSRCGTQFCYICGADYTEITRNRNTGHKPSCRYYQGGYPH